MRRTTARRSLAPAAFCLAAICLAGGFSRARGAETGILFREGEAAAPAEDACDLRTAGGARGLFCDESPELPVVEWSGPVILRMQWQACADDPVVPDATPAPAEDGAYPRTEGLFSKEYVKLLWADAGHILSSPVRWRAREWGIVALAGTAIAGSILFVDEDLRDCLQNRRNDRNDAVAEFFEPFGAEYSFAILAAFEIEGLIFHDDRSRAVAQDGLAASMISGGITWALKMAVGRSRPNKDEGAHDFNPFGGDHSFPSGHTTQAFAVASVIAAHYDSVAVDVLAYGLATTVAYSRMHTDSHFLSDVAAAALIGTAVGRTLVSFNRDRRCKVGLGANEEGVGLWVSVTF